VDLSEESFALSSDHESRVPVEEIPQPLNEITEVDEEDDEVVTVLKTPHPLPLHAKPQFTTQEEFMESPLAGKSVPQQNEDFDLEGSDKENIPQSPVKRVFSTPRPSDRSDSFVTAPNSFPVDETLTSEEVPEPQRVQQTAEQPNEAIRNDEHREVPQEQIIETQVPVATSPPQQQMHLPSLPTRAPLNMKKSFGVRKSHRTSLMETLAGRASIIPNRKTFFGQVTQNLESTASATESIIKPTEQKPVSTEPSIAPSTTPVEKLAKPVTKHSKEDNPKGKKEKDDTITIIDTELHLGDQRLQSKFMTESQRIHDALNSLKLKSTPGQPLRDAQEKILEAETPAPVRTAVAQEMEVDEEEDWIPRKDYSSLAEKLASEQPPLQVEPEEPTPSEAVENQLPIIEKSPEVDVMSPPAGVQKAASPFQSPIPQPTVSQPPAPSPSASVFQSAAAHAMDVIRNALGVITHPHPVEPEQTQPSLSASKPQSLYPRLSEDLDPEPMADIQNENFTIHCDDRASMDSTYFTQSDGPSQPQPEPSQPHSHQSHHPDRQSQPPMPPPQNKKPDPKPKPVPVSIRVPTASQRQKEQQKKIATTTIYPTLTQSRSVPDLATPGKLARDDTSRMSSVSVQSTGSFMKGGGQIKALNAAKLAKQREEQERERKAAKKLEMEKKRQEVMQRQKERDEERRKQLNTQKKTIAKVVLLI